MLQSNSNTPFVRELYKDFKIIELKSASVGDCQMQHLDFAYALSFIRTFMQDESLVLDIRGRKYTPEFEFNTSLYQISKLNPCKPKWIVALRAEKNKTMEYPHRRK